jgi:calcium-dependent protein kinase
LLRKLDHPNILKVYEAYLYKGHYCIITELCEGGTLTAHIREGRRVTERVIRVVFRKLMGALAYLHELGIAHRDIKLDNILLVHRESGAGGSWDIRLIDFGLARVLTARRMRDRERVGTYTHVAPEVLRGVYSTKCDLWSAGIVLCCLATGTNPFKKTTKEHTYESIIKTNLKLEGTPLSTQAPNGGTLAAT